jgi:hypothetical protein
MTAQWKVLHAEGNRLFVLFKREPGEATVLPVTWDGKTPLEDMLRNYYPFPVPADPSIDGSQHVGKSGTSVPHPVAPPTTKETS